MIKIVCDKVRGLIVSFGLLFCVVVLTLLFLASMFFSFNFDPSKETGFVSTLFSDPFFFIIAILLSAVASFLLYLIHKQEHLPDWKKFLIVGCCIVFVFQLWWIFSQRTDTTLFPDSLQMMSFATALVNGNVSEYFNSELPSNVSDMLEGTLYFVNYPYQLSGEFYFYIIAKLFGEHMPIAFQIINALCNVATIAVVSGMFALIVKENNKRVICVLLLCLCLPNLLYSSFIYCNQVGLFLIALFCYLNVRALMESTFKRQMLYVAVSIVPFSFMCWFKSTFVIVGVALLICWFIYVLKKRCSKGLALLLTFCAVFYLSIASVAIPNKVMEEKIGYSFGKGTPKIAWIAMGLQDEENSWANFPGWWNRFNCDLIEKTNNNYEEMENLSKNSISERTSYFLNNPSEAGAFFTQKLASEWCATDFGACYYSTRNMRLSSDGEYVNFMNYNAVGTLQTSDSLARKFVLFTSPFMRAHLLFVYLFAALGSYSLFKNRKNLKCAELVLPCIFAIGFFVYVLWEAKAQYVLSFFFLLIPLSANGFFSFVDFAKNRLHK